ncbi:bacterial regulatory helix-turn-helix, lysR family protein [Janthinobacterium agaricidamnosum NBRC 102515 = DSM 9628]|uniref:Bacterial regulatory helix-turn-helix, lysR family protein n=2 Tax=Janthinobacterium agaricidamnosum TaxID=55508 RepID=W0V727_9BURK|nr:bacterial regulatory helix-turn-helix, lysR family protein [Janthinobacterium agaricidamnosum NBRC 102515 = DSM 9628]
MHCFVSAAEAGSFAEAGRRLALSAAAVGQNVARLEAGLGVRLFQRTTRSLTLTEAGERFLDEVREGLAAIQTALANTTSAQGRPAGTLKISMGIGFGREYILPLLPDFLARYPAVVPDWHFDNRPVDLIAQGFDAAIGGGFDLPPGLVARVLAPAHRVLLASPAYLAGAAPLAGPADLALHAGILIKSPQTGRVRPWLLRNRDGQQAPIGLPVRMTMSDPDAACQLAQLGLGLTLVGMPNALPYLENGTLVRVLPDWYVDGGNLSLYFADKKLLPSKTRVFVDYVVAHFEQQHLARRLSAMLHS